MSVPNPYVLASILASGREGELILGPPYIPSYGGRGGESHMSGPDRHDLHGRRMTSSGTGIPACCSTPAATAPAHVLLHTHRRVPPLINPARRHWHPHTLPMRGAPPYLPLRTPVPVPFCGHFPYQTRSSYRLESAAPSIASALLPPER